VFPRLCAHFWPVELEAVSGPFDNGHYESNIGLFGGVNWSGREVGGKSGGAKDRHEANQNLLDQTPYQADEKYIRDQ
jgi:hypothetical protein